MTLPVGSAANSSLGAVGGARGTAAGAIRILVEFLTQYDSKAVKALEEDLADLENREAGAARRQTAAANGLANATERRAKAEKELARLVSLQDKPGGIRRELREIRNIGVGTKEGKARLAQLDKELGLGGRLVALETRIANQKRQQARFGTLVERSERAQTIAAEQRLAVEQRLSGFQKLKAQVPGKLAGLALGAIGGIVGGAVLGVGFAAAEALLDKVGSALQDIFDPARHAREQLKGVGDAINTLAENEENAGDRLQATIQYLKELGVAADEASIALLAEAAAIQTGREALEARQAIFEVTSHTAELEKQLRDDTISQLIKEAKARGDLVTTTEARGRVVSVVADRTYYAAEADRVLAEAHDVAAIAARRAAAEAQNLEAARRQQAGAAQLAAFAEQQLASILSRVTSARTGGIDDQISALRESGDSARTRALEAKIEALRDASSGASSQNTELANIAEERALILLRQRLRLLGTNIDLEKYSGKFLLAAIEAKQRALQKEADAQDRLNKLLNLQFRMSQVIRRNEGETISDFLERRAQENRDMLSEQRDLEREVVEERLEELKAKTEDEVALQELAERAKTASARAGSDNRIRLLQKELEASRAADRKALQAKIDALEKQKKAYEDLAATVEKYSQQQTNDQIREALRAAKTVQELAALNGEASGLAAAYNFLNALLTSGTLSAAEAALVKKTLSRISSTLSSLESRTIELGRQQGIRHFAAGGIIQLNNASTPFGSNVRFGEQGTEAAVILQHKIAEGLKSQSGVGSIGPFYMDRSDNPLRDRYEMKKLVREAVQEALG